jgi:hypothetical protein
MKHALKILPYVLVVFSCLVSQPALNVGLSESDFSQNKQRPATAGNADEVRSTFDVTKSDKRFDLLGSRPVAGVPNQPFALPTGTPNVPQQSTDSADGLWRNVKESEIASDGQRAAGPNAYRTLALDRAKLTTILSGAPLESRENAAQPIQLTLPFADGTFQTFRVVESPIMEPALAAQFPDIKTYRGQGLDDPTATTRFDWTSEGFHAMVLSSKGTVLIEPYNAETTESYIVYFQRDVPVNSFDCEVSEEEQENAIAESKKLLTARALQPDVISDSNLRTYRLAVAATAEYTQKYGGGTVPGAFSAITTTVNLVDAIYEREVAVRLVLIANEAAIIFTDTTTDGYTSDNVSSLISENQTKLDSVIGSANYDIGHVFDGRSEAPGFFSFQGLASIGSVCRDGFKARGVSITRSVQPSSVIASYNMAHEVGHQFGATHTFNATTANCASARAPSTAYEPGTGSTIMGYRFTCGAEDLMSSDTYFHTASLEQIVNYTNLGSGSSCPVLTATGNAAPTVDAGPTYTIPQGTPFTLGALGSDANGDDLTFCWEEFDLGAASPPSTDDGSRPIFRSFAPISNPSRTFPRLSDILNGFPSFGESLPVTTRTMNFRVTARDDRFDGGGINLATTQVNVRADSGPFKVTQPAAGSNWLIGTSLTVTWDVANTNSAPVSCSSVRIFMSINGGLDFPIVLAEDTPNDGSETVSLPIPIRPSSSIRIKVAAKGNIFFNISGSVNVVQPSNSMQFSSAGYSGSEGNNPKQVNVVITRTGDISGGARADYATRDSFFGVSALSRSDYEVAAGVISFAPGEAQKTIAIPIIDDSYPEGAESFDIMLGNIIGASFGSPTSATVTINDNDAALGQNQIDQPNYFVRQQYIDFLNREPDSSGLAFWTDQITQCGTDAACIEVKRINVSAAFYLSIEFQETGFLVYRVYKAAFGDTTGNSTLGGSHSITVPMIRFHQTQLGVQPAQFIADTRRVSEGVVVNQPGWEQVLEDNKKIFLAEFIQKNSILVPGIWTPAGFVDTLNKIAGNPLAVNERNQLVADLTFGNKTQADVLRTVAEDSDFVAAEKNRAFVLMQYFGYLRRNPNDTPDSDFSGYNFWLSKLNQFNGNFVQAEMVKAFINSSEYRQRFGP